MVKRQAVKFDDLARSRVLVVGDVCMDVWILVDTLTAKEGEAKRFKECGRVEREGMAGCAFGIGRAIGVEVVGAFISTQSVNIQRTRLHAESEAVAVRLDRNRQTVYSDGELDRLFDAACLAHEQKAFDAILICDHGLGFIPNVDHAQRWVQFAIARQMISVVDPRPKMTGVEWWRGAWIVKANDSESRMVREWEKSVGHFVRTLGARGWELQTAGYREKISGKVDPQKGSVVGAGDAFAITLAAAIPHTSQDRDGVAAACDLAGRVAAWHVQQAKLATEVSRDAIRGFVERKSGVAAKSGKR